MTGAVTPRPEAELAPAPRTRRVAALMRAELRTLLRNGEQALLLLVIPVGLLLAAPQIPRLEQTGTPGALTIALVASTFTSIAIATAFERRYGLLRAMAATPADRMDLIAAKGITAMSVATVQVVVLTVSASLMNRPVPSMTATAAAVVLAAVSCTPWAFVLATTARAEQVLVIANLVFMGAMASLFWPTASILIPTSALISLINGPSVLAAGVLVVWGVAGAVVARHWGRWND